MLIGAESQTIRFLDAMSLRTPESLPICRLFDIRRRS